MAAGATRSETRRATGPAGQRWSCSRTALGDRPGSCRVRPGRRPACHRCCAAHRFSGGRRPACAWRVRWLRTRGTRHPRTANHGCGRNHPRPPAGDPAGRAVGHRVTRPGPAVPLRRITGAASILHDSEKSASSGSAKPPCSPWPAACWTAHCCWTTAPTPSAKSAPCSPCLASALGPPTTSPCEPCAGPTPGRQATSPCTTRSASQSPGTPGARKEAEQISQRWRPWRSYALVRAWCTPSAPPQPEHTTP